MHKSVGFANALPVYWKFSVVKHFIFSVRNRKKIHKFNPVKLIAANLLIEVSADSEPVTTNKKYIAFALLCGC